jgi:hypothetical protein
MGKVASTIEDKLPEFQKYLLEKNLATVRNVPFRFHAEPGLQLEEHLKIRDRGFFHDAPPSRYHHFAAASSFLIISVFSQR